ncbi:MAG: hypothetical protein E7058_07385 [Lentisphaerae bacterium]|nr:hypothetical protein [Lentisphaerota bacterium]
MRSVLFLLIGMMLLFSGCAGDQESPEKLAAAVVEAIVDGEEDDLWKLFSPEMREKMVKEFGKSEDETKEKLLEVLQTELKEKYSAENLEQFEDDQELFNRACRDLLKGENKMSNVDGEWFINLQ